MYMRERAAATLRDEDLYETDSEEAGSSGSCHDRSGSSEVPAVPVTSTPLLQRLRMQLTWGTTTREEKRSLWSSKFKRGRREQKQCQISVPTEVLLQALKGELRHASDGASDDAVAELSALLRLQVRHELMDNSLWLVDAFDVLSSADHTGLVSSPRDGGGGGGRGGGGRGGGGRGGDGGGAGGVGGVGVGGGGRAAAASAAASAAAKAVSRTSTSSPIVSPTVCAH